MIQIMMLPNPELFLSVVNQSRGAIFLHLPDHSRVNLKENRIAQQMIQLMKPEQGGLLLDVTNSKDVSSFVRYLSESGLEKEER